MAKVILDTVWMICMPENRGVVYAAAGSGPRDAWQALEDLGLFSATDCRKQGYRARKVRVVLVDDE